LGGAFPRICQLHRVQLSGQNTAQRRLFFQYSAIRVQLPGQTPRLRVGQFHVSAASRRRIDPHPKKRPRSSASAGRSRGLGYSSPVLFFFLIFSNYGFVGHTKKNRYNPFIYSSLKWSGRADLNRRPPTPEVNFALSVYFGLICKGLFLQAIKPFSASFYFGLFGELFAQHVGVSRGRFVHNTIMERTSGCAGCPRRPRRCSRRRPRRCCRRNLPQSCRCRSRIAPTHYPCAPTA